MSSYRRLVKNVVFSSYLLHQNDVICHQCSQHSNTSKHCSYGIRLHVANSLHNFENSNPNTHAPKMTCGLVHAITRQRCRRTRVDAMVVGRRIRARLPTPTTPLSSKHTSFTARIHITTGGVVAEWLARSTRVRKDTGSNPAGAGHYVTTVGKLFTPTVPSRAEGRLNQLAPGTAVPL